MLRLLASHPLRKINLRRPFDRLDRGKTLQQILGQMSKVSPRQRRWPAEGSLQLFEEDFLLTRAKIATNSAKNKSIGSATGPARLRHRVRGSPAITNIRGSTTRTPTVSPIHHETQLVTRSGSSTTPRANRPPNDKVALVKQETGDRNKKRHKSRSLSRGAG